MEGRINKQNNAQDTSQHLEYVVYDSTIGSSRYQRYGAEAMNLM
jgi:hypothetical protein